MTAPTDHAIWSAALNTALLGTDRGAPPFPSGIEALGNAVSALTRDDRGERDAADAVLRVAVATAVYRRCGWLPPRVDTTTALLPCPADERSACSSRAAAMLRRMLLGEHATVLGEWLSLASHHHVLAPADALPDLLELARREPRVRSVVAQAAGARGAWLGALNPDWAFATAAATPDTLVTAWETGTGAARVAALQELRHVDPPRARELLESSWARESPGERAAFLAALATELSAADEDFLERALDDRRKEVRQRASALLATLPTSALVARMTERARKLLSLGRSSILRRLELHVALPSDPDAALVRDGIDTKPPAGLGERAWWLAQIVGSVPPSTWTAAGSADRAALIRAAEDTEWREAIMAGWLTATERFRDAVWAEALWQNERIARTDPRWNAPPPERVFVTLVAAERVDTELRNAIGAGRDVLRGSSPVLAALLEWPHPWSDALARAVARRLKEYATDNQVVLAAEFGVRALLQRCAHAVPASAASAFTEGWPPEASENPVWSQGIDSLASILQFRNDVHLAFNEGSST